jgi:hypothetical protein
MDTDQENIIVYSIFAYTAKIQDVKKGYDLIKGYFPLAGMFNLVHAHGNSEVTCFVPTSGIIKRKLAPLNGICMLKCGLLNFAIFTVKNLSLLWGLDHYWLSYDSVFHTTFHVCVCCVCVLYVCVLCVCDVCVCCVCRKEKRKQWEGRRSVVTAAWVKPKRFFEFDKMN